MKLGEVSWIYQARRVATQANAAGGAMTIDITLAAGQLARLIACRVNNSGTNGLVINENDEDNATGFNMMVVGSGAATAGYIPSIGTAANASGNVGNSSGFVLPSGAELTISQTVAGIQNDTLTIYIVLELFNLPTIPTWSKARSVNQADVTLAASTISAANTLTAGRIWT